MLFKTQNRLVMFREFALFVQINTIGKIIKLFLALGVCQNWSVGATLHIPALTLGAGCQLTTNN